MTVIKCDRCGKDMRDRAESYEINVLSNKTRTLRIPDSYDLCEDCKETLLAWLHPEK